MSALTVAGYIILTIGVVLFAWTVIAKLVDNGSVVKLFNVEISLPATLVLAVLGGLLAVVGTFGPAFVPRPPEDGGRSTATSTPTSLSDEPTGAAPTEATKPNLTVLEPRPNAIISEDGFPVSGRSNLAVTDSLWVVYRGITNSNPSFQPQSKPCSIASDGAFTCPLQFVGGPEDKSNRFDLFFLLADPAAAQEFLDYEASNPAKRDYPGLDMLPRGVQQLGSVTVQRQ